MKKIVYDYSSKEIVWANVNKKDEITGETKVMTDDSIEAFSRFMTDTDTYKENGCCVLNITTDKNEKYSITCFDDNYKVVNKAEVDALVAFFESHQENKETENN